MVNQYKKVERYLQLLNGQRFQNVTPIDDIDFYPCEYKTDNTLPSLSLFRKFQKNERWGEGFDTHAWFHFTLPAVGENTFLRARTEYSGWDGNNPQFLTYINGKIVQGMDVNHTEVLLPVGEPLDIYLYGYTGNDHKDAAFFLDTYLLKTEINALYYDLLYPFETLSFLGKETDEYAQVLYHLWRAVSLLDMYEVGSDEFEASIAPARNYMETEFYSGYCNTQKTTTVCIGHTHIDCAWLWTLKQTREKVQRSFATVLELMRRYPEYKFMSSQAFLYKNLKEEAPDLYEEVKARIKEGRWECEGSMWVEADCNLSSGESLIRQVLYGKRYFKEEFGVDNRILWLPDVFGYSAALPQILRKCGVDWFVTSKISWNDADRMPYDTFTWRGIDGTEIPSYFLTAQDAKREPSVTYTTYVANTHAPMVSGTHKRYSQKQLNNESILTFGFGDGGGGPTAEHLELIRRGARGIPGTPNAKIDFAGNFLSRLEEKIKENPLLPTWQGELYLEFHRGTYTTMARNKRNNRKSEFLYQNAELYGTIANELASLPFPQEKLHRGWEMILTNQFHDIIPGSSIKEVYEQSDIDYARIKEIGTSVVTASQRAILSGIAKNADVLFNPNAQGGRVYAKKNGKTVRVENAPALGYAVIESAYDKNSISINGKCVETNALSVKFDENWQLLSVYDKKNARELLKAGCAGNELRVYADHPDSDYYDAWEWSAYSREQYKALTAVTSAEVIEDGARRGIRITRPHMHSTVTQAVWFYDDEARIDFETVADWHERHQMLKAAFPIDINTDHATYEIQFGSIERPTHFNTSWDHARFEVCGQKYADLSDGGFGVSLINDCKYGHDIHNGLMQLSLLRSPTYPNTEADQGIIEFTYSICPHAGRAKDSDVVKTAYMLNNPPIILTSEGNATTVPTTFSALSGAPENIVCETVKPAEDGNGTVLRIYECHNKRTPTTLSLGIPGKKLCLCNMLEEPIREIPLVNGTFEYTFGGFEIATFKVI